MLKELGKYKDCLYSILANDKNICQLLLGKDYANKFDDLDMELEQYILPHLYTEPVVTDTQSYIFFETYMPRASPTIKTMKISVQAVCHKNIARYTEKPQNYYGLRYDILSQYIEELLCPSDKETIKKRIKQFGIGRFELQSVDLILSNDFVGRNMTFIVPDFR